MAAISALTTKGVRGELMDRIGKAPVIWPQHCTPLDSKTQVEPHAWMGALPPPRQMIDGRRLQGMRAFTYNVENQEWELSFLLPRRLFEDDQTGNMQIRIQEVADLWTMNKEYLFAQMLINGATAGNLAYDALTFFHDTRTEGSSGTIDNATTSAAATGTIPTASEFLDAMAVIKALMFAYLDDQGRNPANFTAMTDVRVVIPPHYERAAKEALEATMLSNTSNVFGAGLAKADICPFLTDDAIMYVHAVGAPVKGIIYQQRKPLEILVYTDPYWVDANNGVVVTLRERFVFAYGQFRRMVQHTFS